MDDVFGTHTVPAAERPPANIEQLRRVERADVLGGLIHEYRHAA